MNGKMKNFCIFGLLALSLVVSTFCYSEQTEEIDQLVSQLKIQGGVSSKASFNLINIGAPAVPALCNALENLDPALNNAEDAALLFGTLTTLGMIAGRDNNTMAESVPSLYRAMQRMDNKQARALIVGSLSTSFPSPEQVPYIIDLLRSEIEGNPSDNEGYQHIQGFVSLVFINMVGESPENAKAIFDGLSVELKTAKETFKRILLVQIANLALDPANEANSILQQALQSETDSDMQKHVEELLKFVREKIE